jgi:23S rRNA (pseudouridine1915-N3)-methyltransferase
MKLSVVTVGQKLPGWAQEACDEFAKRFRGDVSLQVKTIKAEPRDGKPTDQIMAAEGARIESAITTLSPSRVRRVVCDERGTRLTTVALAERLKAWQLDGSDVALVIGGADGLDPALKSTADETVRLSDLTLPHALARVLLIEALYRAWSLNIGHPYHRE